MAQAQNVSTHTKTAAFLTGIPADIDVDIDIEPADPEEIIQNSKTLNLPEDDEKFLSRFVKAFIQSAEKEFLRPSSRTHLESFAKVCTTFTAVAIGTVPGVGVVGKSIVKAAVKTTSTGLSGVLATKKIVDHKNAVREVNNFLIQADKENTDPVEVIFRQFLGKISTDIFLRYMEQIRQWTSTQGYIYIDEIGDVFGQRCCYKLKQIDLQKGDTYESIVQKFIGSDNIGKTVENWFLETTKFKVEDYRSIFHDPIPALYVQGQLKVKRSFDVSPAQAGGNEPIAPKWLSQNGKILFEQLRPPFNFEQRDMASNEKDLLTVNVKTAVTNISIEKFVWEDPTPLASKICKKLEVELNPFKKIRDEAEKHRDVVIDAQGKTQVAVDKLIQKQKRSESLNKIKCKSTAANPLPYFTGREDLLEEIHKKLKKCNLCRTGSNASSYGYGNGTSSGTGSGSGFASTSTTLLDKMVFLVGPEGYGKTETAKKYAKTYLKEYYTNIIWIDAGSFESLKRSFENAAREWGIDLHSTAAAKIQFQNKSYDFDADQKRATELCQVVYQHFIDVGSGQNSLFIFDNAQVMTDVGVGVGNTAKRNGFGIGKFLPQQRGVYLPVFLVTSNNFNLGSRVHLENTVRIEKLPQSDTLSLLNTRFDIKTEDSSSKSSEYGGLQESLTELGKILDGFPLGLDIIAASILGNFEQDQ